MRSLIRYIPQNILLDLSEPDLGQPDGRRILEDHYHNCHRDRPVFECMTHLGGTNPAMFLKKIEQEWWAVHFERGICKPKKVHAPMSDEHKRQVEYWVRAADDAGLAVETERTLTSRTRPDVLIHGPIKTGIEVQRSALSRAGAIERTRRAAQAGVADIWSTDRDKDPYWAYRVPTVSHRRDSWQYLPPKQSVLANGVRQIEAVRCVAGEIPRCPTRRQYCGKYHPASVPAVVALDDIAWRFPAADIVALKLPAITGTKAGVYLCSAKSAARYTELTGLAAPTLYRPSASQPRLQSVPGRVECRNEQPVIALAACGVCRQGFVDVDQFEAHQVVGYDGRLICPDSPARYPLPSRHRSFRHPNLA